MAECGTTNGQGWDLITAGMHNDAANSTLVVSTLTNACLNFDPRGNAAEQVVLFSCGGRADGSECPIMPYTPQLRLSLTTDLQVASLPTRSSSRSPAAQDL